MDRVEVLMENYSKVDDKSVKVYDRGMDNSIEIRNINDLIPRGVFISTDVKCLSTYYPSINDYLRQIGSSKKEMAYLKAAILRIVNKYLTVNVKGKAISTPEQLEILIEEIINTYGNLELQEIAFVLKNGVLGKYGVIYNDISLDTILGKYDRKTNTGGWFSCYYELQKGHRPPRPQIEGLIAEPDSINYKEFLKRNPTVRRFHLMENIVNSIRRNYNKRRSNNSRKAEMKAFYKLNGLSEAQMYEDIEIQRKNLKRSFNIDGPELEENLSKWMTNFIEMTWANRNTKNQ